MRHEGTQTKAAFTVALQRLLAVLDSVLPESVEQRRSVLLRSVAEFVGAVVLSRATDDDALAGEILQAVRLDAKNTLRGKEAQRGSYESRSD
jgi:TetR/AcrR family transcriptional repressor of nem operon